MTTAMSRAYACIISPNAHEDAAILSAIAYGFAYRIEMLGDGVLFDVSGLEKLVGDGNKIAQNIVKELERNNIAGTGSPWDKGRVVRISSGCQAAAAAFSKKLTH